MKVLKALFLSLFFIAVTSIVLFNHNSQTIKPMFNNATKEILKYRTVEADSLQQKYSSSTDSNEFLSWNRSYGDNGSSRYSLIKDINKENIEDLDLLWEISSEKYDGQIQSTPVIAEGTIYAVSGLSKISAYDGKSGALLWTYKSPIGPVAQRGLIWKKIGKTPVLFFGAGSKLISLNAENGKLYSNFAETGILETYSQLKTTPLVQDNAIIFAGVDPPLIASVDIASGKFLWKNKIHKDSIMKGGNPWGGISLDESRSIVFVTTGNPKPDFVGISRPGDNNDSNSIIAFNSKNGKKLWSFQEVIHDIWDLDISGPPVLTKIIHNNQKVDVVVATTKSGNTLLLNVETGNPIFDYRLREVHQSAIDGEVLSSYQPDLELPEPFSKQNFELSDISNLNKKTSRFVSNSLKNKNFGFYKPHQINVGQIYFGIHGGSSWPGISIDHEAQLMFVASNHIPWDITIIDPKTFSFSLKDRVLFYLRKIYYKLFVPNQKSNISLSSTEVDNYYENSSYQKNCQGCHGNENGQRIAPNLDGISSKYSYSEFRNIVVNGYGGMNGIDDISPNEIATLGMSFYNKDIILNPIQEYEILKWKQFKDQNGFPASKPPWGSLTAIDLNTGKIKWKVPLGEIKDLISQGVPITGSENIGGPTSTAGGLVFIAGTKDELLRAFDSSSGKELWRYKIPYVGTAPPAVYEIDNVQYVLIMGSGGGKLSQFDNSVKNGFSISVFALKKTNE